MTRLAFTLVQHILQVLQDLMRTLVHNFDGSIDNTLTQFFDLSPKFLFCLRVLRQGLFIQRRELADLPSLDVGQQVFVLGVVSE